ncbi:MAG: hypothetical protein LBG98_00760 [Puniceicoccales bacterium]|nr:hypothetical protein [Puniceicoccales bacterium]
MKAPALHFSLAQRRQTEPSQAHRPTNADFPRSPQKKSFRRTFFMHFRSIANALLRKNTAATSG